MARSLHFLHPSGPFEATIIKVDRGKLYGSRELETLDSEGHLCTLATMAADGHSLIPVGGTAIAHLNAEGLWLEGDQLRPVDADGAPLPLIASSFEAPIALERNVDVEGLLEHSIRLTYALDLLAPLPTALDAELASGAIYGFPFSWRGGADADPAFLLRGEDGTLWMLVGEANSIEEVGLEPPAPWTSDADLEDQEAPGRAEDPLDFRML